MVKYEWCLKTQTDWWQDLYINMDLSIYVNGGKEPAPTLTWCQSPFHPQEEYLLPGKKKILFI